MMKYWQCLSIDDEVLAVFIYLIIQVNLLLEMPR